MMLSMPEGLPLFVVLSVSFRDPNKLSIFPHTHTQRSRVRWLSCHRAIRRLSLLCKSDLSFVKAAKANHSLLYGLGVLESATKRVPLPLHWAR